MHGVELGKVGFPGEHPWEHRMSLRGIPGTPDPFR